MTQEKLLNFLRQGNSHTHTVFLPVSLALEPNVAQHGDVQESAFGRQGLRLTLKLKDKIIILSRQKPHESHFSACSKSLFTYYLELLLPGGADSWRQRPWVQRPVPPRLRGP